LLKHLNVEEMVGLTAPWVDAQRAKPVFVSIPEIEPLYDKIAVAHAALVAVRPAVAIPSPSVAALLAEEEAADARHDHLARAISSALEAHAERCLAEDPPNEARSIRCRDVQGKLFPNGLSIVNASFVAESGNATRVAHLIENDEPAITTFLETITVSSKATLADDVRTWVSLGVKLGALEHAREATLAQESASKGPTNASILAARNTWIRLVSQVLSMLDLSDGAPEAIEQIRAPILRASERASRRYGIAKTDLPGEDATKLTEEPTR
jgi:hypothetical protein